jgi:hypothetical protein
MTTGAPLPPGAVIAKGVNFGFRRRQLVVLKLGKHFSGNNELPKKVNLVTLCHSKSLFLRVDVCLRQCQSCLRKLIFCPTSGEIFRLSRIPTALPRDTLLSSGPLHF